MRKITNPVLSLIVMLLWGSLFPVIKMGYIAFGINTDSVADILMFAALRFSFCGIVVCLIAWFSKSDIAKPKMQNIFSICLMGIFAIVLHYGFTYVGLTKADSSKTAILKQLANFICSAPSLCALWGQEALLIHQLHMGIALAKSPLKIRKVKHLKNADLFA